MSRFLFENCMPISDEVSVEKNGHERSFYLDFINEDNYYNDILMVQPVESGIHYANTTDSQGCNMAEEESLNDRRYHAHHHHYYNSHHNNQHQHRDNICIDSAKHRDGLCSKTTKNNNIDFEINNEIDNDTTKDHLYATHYNNSSSKASHHHLHHQQQKLRHQIDYRYVDGANYASGSPSSSSSSLVASPPPTSSLLLRTNSPRSASNHRNRSKETYSKNIELANSNLPIQAENKFDVPIYHQENTNYLRDPIDEFDHSSKSIDLRPYVVRNSQKDINEKERDIESKSNDVKANRIRYSQIVDEDNRHTQQQQQLLSVDNSYARSQASRRCYSASPSSPLPSTPVGSASSLNHNDYYHYHQTQHLDDRMHPSDYHHNKIDNHNNFSHPQQQQHHHHHRIPYTADKSISNIEIDENGSNRQNHIQGFDEYVPGQSETIVPNGTLIQNHDYTNYIIKGNDLDEKKLNHRSFSGLKQNNSNIEPSNGQYGDDKRILASNDVHQQSSMANDKYRAVMGANNSNNAPGLISTATTYTDDANGHLFQDFDMTKPISPNTEHHTRNTMMLMSTPRYDAMDIRDYHRNFHTPNDLQSQFVDFDNNNKISGNTSGSAHSGPSIMNSFRYVNDERLQRSAMTNSNCVPSSNNISSRLNNLDENVMISNHFDLTDNSTSNVTGNSKKTSRILKQPNTASKSANNTINSNGPSKSRKRTKVYTKMPPQMKALVDKLFEECRSKGNLYFNGPLVDHLANQFNFPRQGIWKYLANKRQDLKKRAQLKNKTQ